MVKLRAWREAEKLTVRQAAERFGMRPNVYHRYEQDPGHPEHRTPNRAAMQTIFDGTGGQVTPNDFYELPGARAEAEAPADDAAPALRADALFAGAAAPETVGLDAARLFEGGGEEDAA